ncbi:MAG: HAD-IIIA family hydrolase, partial [Bacteroidales bacterium]
REQLVIKENVIEALSLLRPLFGRIIIVTNQQGIGKGICTQEAVEDIHQYLMEYLSERNLPIDRIYYCPHLASDQCDCRKPQTAMAERAQADFPEIDFRKSIMVGDHLSDLEFGKRCGMKTIFVGRFTFPEHEIILDYADYCCYDLFDFARLI